MRTFSDGASCLRRGWGLMRQRPRLLVLGMVPALVVFCLFLGLFILLATHLGGLTDWLTPFADDWIQAARQLLRFGLGFAIIVAAVLLWLMTFTGLTLTVGDPFYERIWRQSEHLLGPVELGAGPGFWRSVRDGLRLSLIGLACSALVLIIGFVPVVGPVVGICLGVSLSGRLLARELLSRPLGARGLDDEAQRALLRPHRRAVWGFGIATQACFLVPLGGVVVMPAAVAGASVFAREVWPVPAPGRVPK